MHERPASFTPVTIRRTFPGMTVLLKRQSGRAVCFSRRMQYHKPAMADITFTGCDLLSAARNRTRAQARPAARGKAQVRPARQRREAVAAGRRREVVVGGRRGKTIEGHAHCGIPEAYALLGIKV